MRLASFALVAALSAAAPVVSLPAKAQSRLATAPFELPVPSGPHAVGTTALTVSRRVQGSDAPRLLKVIVWYPAAYTIGRTRAPYLREESALRAMAALGRNPATPAIATNGVRTHGWLDAPCSMAPCT